MATVWIMNSIEPLILAYNILLLCRIKSSKNAQFLRPMQFLNKFILFYIYSGCFFGYIVLLLTSLIYLISETDILMINVVIQAKRKLILSKTLEPYIY